MKRPSATTLAYALEQSQEEAHALAVAFIDRQPNARHVGKDRKDRYVRTVYRITGPVGGYIVDVFHSGTVKQRPSIQFAGRLDTWLARVPPPGTDDYAQQRQSAEYFVRVRWEALNQESRT